jgi:nucleoside-diphosphate-sugar epimerase
MNFAITGASGYLGSELSNYLENLGHKVIRLNRKNYDLKKPNLKLEDTNLDVLIHCAFDKSIDDKNSYIQANVIGSIKLFNYAQSKGIRIIFISSISAMLDNKSKYSSAKFSLENHLLNIKDSVSIRPGLIVGGSKQGGMVGMLEKKIEVMKLLPVPGGKTNLYICNMEKLCQIIELIAVKKISPVSPILICEPLPVTFVQLIKSLAEKKGKKCLIFPVNIHMIYIFLKVLEFIKFNIGFKSDSLRGIFSSPDALHIKEELKKTNRFLKDLN